MFDSESTISQPNYNYELLPAEGFQLRLYSELWDEIGLEPSILLLQLDYWIKKRGFEQGDHRWLRLSAKTMCQWAFHAWSQRKVQRLTKLLQEAGLLLVEYFDGPYTTPYLALNKAAITEKLKSVHIVDPTEQADQSSSDKIDDQPPTPATPTVAAVPGDNSNEAIDAPSARVAELPPSTTVTTYKKDQEDHVSTEAAGVQSKKTSKRQRKIIKRESARSADRAKRGTSSLNGEKQVMFDQHFSSIKKSGWDAFCEKLAEICGVDFELEPGYIRTWASKLWKKGDGYTIEDLEDFIAWWNKYDWRGAKNKTRPYPKQVVECIRQSCEHEHTKIRRYVRECGYSPDDEEAIERYGYFLRNEAYLAANGY